MVAGDVLHSGEVCKFGGREPPIILNVFRSETALDENKKTVLKDLTVRMKRIEGQARGIRNMLEEGRDCEEVILQLSAMRAAIGKVAMAVMANYLEQCLLVHDGEEREQGELIDRAKRIFLKFS